MFCVLCRLYTVQCGLMYVHYTMYIVYATVQLIKENGRICRKQQIPPKIDKHHTTNVRKNAQNMDLARAHMTR